MKLTDKQKRALNSKIWESTAGVVQLPANIYDDIMLLTNGCGRGKTSFVLSTGKGGLLDLVNKRRKQNVFIGEEIPKDIEPHELWFAVPRAAIRDQQIADGNAVALTAADYSNCPFDAIENRDKPRIATAHQLGQLLFNGDIKRLPAIIGFDEMHSAFAETTFAKDLLYSLQELKDSYDKMIKFGLTATPEFILDYIKDNKLNFKTIDMELDSRYFVNQIKIAIGTNAKAIVKQLNINGKNKVLVYKQSASACYRAAMAYGERAAFLISDYNKTRVDGVNITKYMKDKGWKEYVIKTKQFPEDIDIIFMTSALREGLNIEDQNVNKIVCEAVDMITIEQVLGRLRKDLDQFIVVANLRYETMNKQKMEELAQFHKTVDAATTEEEKQKIMEARYNQQIELEQLDDLMDEELDNDDDNEKSGNYKKRLTVAVYKTKEGKYALNPYARPYFEYINDCYLQLKHSEKYYDTLTSSDRQLKLRKLYFEQLQKFTHNAIEIEEYWTAAININHDNAIDKFKSIDSDYIGVPLTTADKKELCAILNPIRSKGQTAKWTTVKPMLESAGYTIKDTQRRINGKCTRVSIISKDNE